MTTNNKSLLHRFVLNILKESPRSLQDIATETGLTIYWLQKFRADLIPAPSAQRLERLFEFLMGVSFQTLIDAAIAWKNKNCK